MVETRKSKSKAPTKASSCAQDSVNSEDEDDFQPESPEDEFVEGSSNSKSMVTCDPYYPRAYPLSERKRAPNSPKANSTSKRAGKSSQSKAKTAGANSAKAGGKRHRTLSLLPTMPLDVLYEVYVNFIVL